MNIWKGYYHIEVQLHDKAALPLRRQQEPQNEEITDSFWHIIVYIHVGMHHKKEQLLSSYKYLKPCSRKILYVSWIWTYAIHFLHLVCSFLDPLHNLNSNLTLEMFIDKSSRSRS